MKRLFPVVILAPLFFASQAVAQSALPSIPDVFGIADDGTTDIDIAAAQEAVATGISEALVTTAGGVIETLPDILNPDLLNPDVFADGDPGVGLLELIAALGEAVRGAVQQQGRVLLDSDVGP